MHPRSLDAKPLILNTAVFMAVIRMSCMWTSFFLVWSQYTSWRLGVIIGGARKFASGVFKELEMS